MFGVKEIDSVALADILENAPDSIRLVDVRSPAEMAQGVLPGSEAVPLHLVPLRATELLESSKPVVFYCRSGVRSAQACAFLGSQGGDPERLINLRGGIMDWVRQGNQVVIPESPVMAG